MVQANTTEQRPHGALEVSKSIESMDARIKNMQNDYARMCDAARSEVAELDREVDRRAVSAALQLAQVGASLMEASAQQWEALAAKLV
jgi:uncharacterized protein YeeX (DUF496 family)